MTINVRNFTIRGSRTYDHCQWCISNPERVAIWSLVFHSSSMDIIVARLAHRAFPPVFVCRVFMALAKTTLTEIVWHPIGVSSPRSDSMPLWCVLLFDWPSELPIYMSVHGIVGHSGEEGLIRADLSSAVASSPKGRFCSRREPVLRRWALNERRLACEQVTL